MRRLLTRIERLEAKNGAGPSLQSLLDALGLSERAKPGQTVDDLLKAIDGKTKYLV